MTLKSGLRFLSNVCFSLTQSAFTLAGCVTSHNQRWHELSLPRHYLVFSLVLCVVARVLLVLSAKNLKNPVAYHTMF